MRSHNFLRLPQFRKATTFFPTSLLVCSSPNTKISTNFSSLSSTYHETGISSQFSTCYTARQPLDFASSLTLSSTTNNPSIGCTTHAQIIKLGFSNDIFTNNNLVWMYSRCQLLNYALNLFYEMPQRNIVSWTSMISSCIHSDEHERGLEIYLEMVRSGFHPNEFTLASALSACAALETTKLGNSFHGVAFKMGCERNSFVSSSLLFMYAKCGNIEAGEMVFDCINHRDLACWNVMAESYALSGYGHDAMRIICLMHLQGLPADKFTFVSALKACEISGNLNFGRQIHSFIIHHELESSTSVMNSLMDMYFRYEMTNSAVQVFYRVPEKDIVSWNTVICGFTVKEDEKGVVAFLSSMLFCGLKPNQVTLSSIFRLCGARENIHLGLQFICFAYRHGFFNHCLVVNALISMFSKCGLMDKAFFLFSSHGNKSTITYNEMIAGCNLNGHFTEALCLFCSLTESGLRSDEFTYTSVLSACQHTQQQKIGELIHAKIIKSGFNSYSYVCTSLINTYERLGSLESSYKIFQGVRFLDLASWGAMISAFTRRSFNCEAFSLLNSLRKIGANPDEFIFGSILNSCAGNGVLNQCRCIHSLVIKTGYEMHLHVASAAIDAYAKCGDINSSLMAFHCVSEDNDVILFNTMITAFAHHGMIIEAIKILETMRRTNMLPTQATFVAVLSACRHLGLVEEGQFVFDSISSVYGMVPSKDNFGCLVDLLARDGLLEKAKNVIESMPYQPWPAVWRSLLSSCRSHGEKEMAKRASEQLQLLQGDDGALVLLSNAHAEDGRWEDAANMRMKIVQQGVHKVPGGYKRFYRRTSLETSDYLKEDCLVMNCTVGVVRNRLETPRQFSIHVPPPDMGSSFRELLKFGTGSDIVFEVGDETFEAHKLILAARSPVFKAQFFGLIGNPNVDKIIVEDVEPPVFKAMLIFMYSDELPDVVELTGSVSMCTSINMVQHLLAAADRYGLERLKLLCEGKLCQEITADTVASTMTLAEQHQCAHLKSVCLKFTAARENLGVILQTEGFGYLEQSCPSLLYDILATVAAEEDSSHASRKRSSSSNLGLTLMDGVDSSGRRTRRRL